VLPFFQLWRCRGTKFIGIVTVWEVAWLFFQCEDRATKWNIAEQPERRRTLFPLKSSGFFFTPHQTFTAIAFSAMTTPIPDDGIRRSKTGIPLPGPERPSRPDWALDETDLHKSMDAVPLFMSSLPEDAGDNPLIQALQDLAYDGTPEGTFDPLR
jgi:hypothetical protein